MKINNRTWLNLGLLLLIGILVTIAMTKPGKQPAPRVQRISQLNPMDVKTIRILRTGEPEIRLENKDNQWLLDGSPVKPANQFRVQALLSLPRSPVLGSYPVKGLDLAQFDLKSPRIRILLDDFEIAFGDTDPINFRRYVRVDDQMHLIEDRVYHHLSAPRHDLIDLRLLPAQAQPESIILPDLSLIRSTENGWSTSPPNQLTPDQINQSVDQWKIIQAVQIKPINTDAKSLGEIQIDLGADSTPIKFEILAREPELILTRPEWGIQYHLPADQSRLLVYPGEDELTPKNRQSAPN